MKVTTQSGKMFEGSHVMNKGVFGYMFLLQSNGEIVQIFDKLSFVEYSVPESEQIQKEYKLEQEQNKAKESIPESKKKWYQWK